jgi:hypothetical protein
MRLKRQRNGQALSGQGFTNYIQNEYLTLICTECPLFTIVYEYNGLLSGQSCNKRGAEERIRLGVGAPDTETTGTGISYCELMSYQPTAETSRLFPRKQVFPV